MKLKRRIKIISLIVLGGISTIMSHAFEWEHQHEEEIGEWTYGGFPLPFHHESFYQANLIFHDWLAFALNIIFWATAWFAIIILIEKCFIYDKDESKC